MSTKEYLKKRLEVGKKIKKELETTIQFHETRGKHGEVNWMRALLFMLETELDFLEEAYYALEENKTGEQE